MAAGAAGRNGGGLWRTVELQRLAHRLTDKVLDLEPTHAWPIVKGYTAMSTRCRWKYGLAVIRCDQMRMDQ